MPNELAEQLYDIFKQVVAARENLLDTHRGEMMRFAQGIEELSSRVRDWVAENQEPIQKLHASVMSIAAQLPEWRDNLEANRLLLERGFEMLESTGYRNVGYLVTLYGVAEFADLSPGAVQARMFEKTSSLEFLNELLELYTSTGLRSDRLVLIQESLELHRERRFGGAVTLIYAQLEGVITDALQQLDLVRVTGNHVKSVEGVELPGLDKKIRCAESGLNVPTEFFSDLLKAKLVMSDPSSTVPRHRNAVLHGSDVAFATEARSSQLLFWLCALLVQLRIVLPTQCRPAESNPMLVSDVEL